MADKKTDAREAEKAREAERKRRTALRSALRRKDPAEVVRLGGVVVLDVD